MIWDQKISTLEKLVGSPTYLAYPLTVGKLTVAIAIDVFCFTALLHRGTRNVKYVRAFTASAFTRWNIYSIYIMVKFADMQDEVTCGNGT